MERKKCVNCGLLFMPEEENQTLCKVCSANRDPESEQTRGMSGKYVVCPNCKRPLSVNWKVCPMCGADPAMPVPETPVYRDYDLLWWYVVPLFFGVIGGLIAYVGVKDRNQGAATNMLLFGILWSFVLFFIGWFWIYPLLF